MIFTAFNVLFQAGPAIPVGVWIFLGILLLLIVAGLIFGARMSENQSPSVRDSNIEDHTTNVQQVNTPETPPIPQTGGGTGTDMPPASAPAAARGVYTADLDTDTSSGVGAIADVEGPSGFDDLTVIEGIGPGVQNVLYGAGITTFDQLANTTPDQLWAIINQSGLRASDPETWPEQARRAAGGRLDDYTGTPDRNM